MVGLAIPNKYELKRIRRVIFTSLGKYVPPQPTQLKVYQMETQEYCIHRFSWRGAGGPMGNQHS